MSVSREIEIKTEAALTLIQQSLSKSEKPVVACSFGKNSIVVLDMVRRLKNNITVLFNNTLVEYPDIYKYKKLITDKWGLKVIETKPLKTFWEIVDQYGFPLFSRKGNSDATKNCCRYLKEYPVDRVLREYKFDLYFTGLSRHESRLREFSARKYGPYFYSKRSKHWKCHPLLDWKDDDIWEYHKLFNIPQNQFYERNRPNGFNLRTGCWCCTIPIKYGKIEFLRLNYPKLWELLLRKGLGELILVHRLGISASESEINRAIKNRPCFFDQY
jgi:3'-phosphoadenosine 5'-phosphosulfate sulfotransferase (PAPS reductase)/FAD synthetase